MECVERVRENY